MPMTVSTREEYEEVLNVSWFSHYNRPEPRFVLSADRNWNARWLTVSTIDKLQFPMLFAFLQNVSALLH